MSTLCLTSKLLPTLRTRGVVKAVLALSLLTSARVGPALAQNSGQNGGQNGAQQGQSSPLVGSWEMQMHMQDGSTLHQFDQYGADGTWRQTAINIGGRSNGVRTQTWGSYSVQSTGNNSFRVMFQTVGFAPMQVCTQGVGCTQLTRQQTFANSYTLVDRNHFRSNDRQGLVTARVAQIPAELTAQLPATDMHAGAPPISTGGAGSSPGYTPMQRPAGVGPNSCDNLQQQRICNLNDGYLYTDRRGCQVCSSGAGR